MTKGAVVLSINPRVKGVPYSPVRHAGSENHGFTILKGRPAAVENIPEAVGSPPIISLLKSLNHPESPFFSVGCEKSFNTAAEGHWAKGYIEFAFNYKELALDAVQYFPLFFQFSQHVEEFVKNNPVQFHWELQPAHFETIGAGGFTTSVWITTTFCDRASNAKDLWERAVLELEGYLSTVGCPTRGTPIYASGC